MYFLMLVPTADKLDAAQRRAVDATENNEELVNLIGKVSGERDDAQKRAADLQTADLKAR